MKALPKILLALTAVAALSVAYPAKANLITNPGFETGDFTGWNRDLFFKVGTSFGVSPHSGNFQAMSFGTGVINQTLTTTPGQSYTISFWAATASDALLEVAFGSPFSTVFSHIFNGATGYTEFTFNGTASSASTFIGFADRVGTLFLDDISVEPAGVGVPDGGSTVSLLGCALLGLAALRRKLSR
jgi:hypothetical protein